MTEQHCKHYFSWKRQGISVQLWTDMSCMLPIQLRIKKLENQQFNIHQESCSWFRTPEKPSRSLMSTGECGRMPPPFKHGEEEEQVENVKSASPMTTWTPKKPQQKLFFLCKFRFAGIPSQMLKKNLLLNTENPSALLRLFILAMSKEKHTNIYFSAKNQQT